MTCTRCGQPIIKGQKHHRTRKGPHHAQCPATVLVYGGALCLPWKAQGPNNTTTCWFIEDAHGALVATADYGTESNPKELAETIVAFVNAHGATWLARECANQWLNTPEQKADAALALHDLLDTDPEVGP